MWLPSATRSKKEEQLVPSKNNRRRGGSRDPRRRHTQFPQESWTELDAEGSDSEMSRGRQTTDPFYTPLVDEAAERRLRRERGGNSGRRNRKGRS